MKVAVSIPDAVFTETELLAKQLKTSRSEIYSRALHEFLGRHTNERVTDLMNRVIGNVAGEPDAFSSGAARHVLERTEW
jgi:metal-responsive CopG/Arc/MetJ family transcriptional regulator